ncbi:transglycosylase SLT domain-containing protein, partial [Gemmatimonadota bacterium]
RLERDLDLIQQEIFKLAGGDSVGARGAYHQVLNVAPRGTVSARAGSALLLLGFDSASAALRGAEALGSAGEEREALQAYGEFEALLGRAPSEGVALARARLHLGLREWRAAVSILRPLAESADASVGVPSLDLLAEALGALGRREEAREVENRLVERHPGTAEAVDVVFFRADALQTAGDLEGAVGEYGRAAALAPSLSRAGQSRMRMGQLLVSLGRDEEAVGVYEEYLSDFPDGRRQDEAAFWAGRTLLSLGRETEGRAFLRRLVDGNPFSYYALQGSLLLGEPFAPQVEVPADTLPFPSYVLEGLRRIQMLRSTGLEAAISPEVERLAQAARISQRDLLRLALELNSLGFTREGISLGWELRRSGQPWDLDLARAIYPFPYREMVLAEAEEWGLDPFFMAGLMRQESAFWAEARSRADARGLMQVLPSTGAELARAVGPAGFRADEHLYRPEVNLHLGMAFFSDLRRRFGEDPVILLSAYNAGPSRAQRWKGFPEANDPVRFIERIPFAETRGYVKNVLLNRALYSWLYGIEEGPGPGTGSLASSFLGGSLSALSFP